MHSSSSQYHSSHRETPFPDLHSNCSNIPRTSSSDKLNPSSNHSSRTSPDSFAPGSTILNTFPEEALKSANVPRLMKPIFIQPTNGRLARAAATKFPGFITGLSVASILLMIQQLFPKIVIFERDDHVHNCINFGIQTLVSYYATVIYQVAIHALISYKIQNSRYSIKYRACRNFDLGIAYGWIPFALYQFYRLTEGHASAFGFLFGSGSIMNAHQKMAKFSESQIDNSTSQDLFNLTRKCIVAAISEGKLDQNEVTMFTKVLPVQNLLIFHSLNTLTAEKFVKIFQKLAMDSEIGPLVTKENIENLQNKIKALRETDKTILENKLAFDEEEFENRKKLQSIFLRITKISFPIWKYYKQVIIDVIDEINPSSFIDKWTSKLFNFMDEE